jgi:hypothetical protein
LLIGAFFISEGVTKRWWPGFWAGVAFVAFGALITKGLLDWFRIQPASSLRIFQDHFCIGAKSYPYKALLGVKLERTRTRKTLNFIPTGVDERIVAKLRLSTGVVLIRAGARPGTFAGPSMGKSEVENFVKTIELLEWRARQPEVDV